MEQTGHVALGWEEIFTLLLEMRWLRVLGSLVLGSVVVLTEDRSDIGGARLGDGRFTCAGKAGL